jgi:hypothetical protein
MPSLAVACEAPFFRRPRFPGDRDGGISALYVGRRHPWYRRRFNLARSHFLRRKQSDPAAFGVVSSL